MDSVLNTIKNFFVMAGDFLSQDGLIDRYNPYAFQIVSAIVLLTLLLFIIIGLVNRKRGGADTVTVRDTTGITTARASQERRQRRRRLHRAWTHSFWYGLLVVLTLIFGAVLRFWNLTGLPDGLQQDEASIGYEAFSLLNYGIDRNGYHFPVYPITWGSGGGSPLMIYLNLLTTALFGSNVWAIRIIPATLGVLTLLLFYCFLRKAFGNMPALGGLIILTLTPWHIILSRWSLDSNTMPFWQILAYLAFLCAAAYAVEPFIGEDEAALSMKKQSHRYALAAFLFALCMYSYGSANFIIPVVLLVMAIWGLRHQIISGGQLAGCIVIFALVCAPLAYFYGVNFLGFPEITTRWISFPKFTSSHFGSVFLAFDSSLPQALLKNAEGLLQMLTFGKQGEVSWNAMPGYWTLYLFTWPVTLAGILFGGRRSETARGAARERKKRRKNGTLGADYTGDVTSVISYIRAWKYRPDRAVDLTDISNALMRTSLITALIFALFVQQDINRNVLLFLPLVYWNVMGMRWIWRIPLLIPKKNAEGKTRKEVRAEQKAAKRQAAEEKKTEKEKTAEERKTAKARAAEEKKAAKEKTAAEKKAAKNEAAEEKKTAKDVAAAAADSAENRTENGTDTDNKETAAAAAAAVSAAVTSGTVNSMQSGSGEDTGEGAAAAETGGAGHPVDAENAAVSENSGDTAGSAKTGDTETESIAASAGAGITAEPDGAAAEVSGSSNGSADTPAVNPVPGDKAVIEDVSEFPIELQFMDELNPMAEEEAIFAERKRQRNSKGKKRRRFYPGHLLAALAFIVFLGGAGLFLRDYYGGTYNRICAVDFMPGYGDAMVYADSLAQNIDAAMASEDKSTVYSTYELVSSPFMITLYYTKYNPFKFLNSVQYKDPDAEFRIAKSFGHFVFGLPVEDETDLNSLTALTDEGYWNDIFVLTKDEAAMFSDADYSKTVFHDRYVVVMRK